MNTEEFFTPTWTSTARGAFQTGTSEITTDLPTVSTYNDNDSKEQNTEHQLHFHEVLPADDADNKALLEHVHPPEHKNPVDDDVYDVIAIGGGAAGLVCTSGVVRHGGKGALIEYSLLGGDCLNIGCVPSKALLSCSKMAASLNKMSKYGLLLSSSSTSSSSSDSSDASNSHPSVTVDFAAIMQRMRNLRAKIAPNDGVPRFNGLGADVYLGHAKFTSPNTVEVTADDKTKTTLKFRKACIATGGRARVPGIKGLKDTSFLTNATLYNLTELPASMGVIGAGAIGCEMAQAFARFGSKVTVFLRSKHLLGKEDPEAAALLLAEMRRDGVHFEFGVQYTSVDHQDGDKSKPIVVSFINKDGEASTTPVDQLLVAAGRVPNVEGLGLEKAGVAYDLHKGVIVNDYLQTSNANIYGTGDACSAVSSARFTHVSGTHGGLVWKNACFDAKQKFSGYVVPAVTYTEPEVAHIGAYQDDIDRWTSDPVLKKQKFGAHSVKTISKTLLHNDRAILDGTNTSGLLKVHHLDDADGTIVGATLVCKHAGDMIMELATCMQNGVGVSAIGSTIHPYPTQSEVIASSGWHFNGGKTTDSIKQLLKEHLEQARAADKQ